MIIFYDNNYPILVLEITSFLEIDYKTIKKNIEYILNDSKKKQQYINLYIDLYDLENYSLLYIGNIIQYITNIKEEDYKFLNRINLFINKNYNIILFNMLQCINMGNIPVNVIKLSEKKYWK